jgi:N-methylhydantoinase A/oxoprolinase/acetone carboxylase beta subunit
LAGPAVVELPESTLLVPPGWRGEVGDTGTIRLERESRR